MTEADSEHSLMRHLLASSATNDADASCQGSLLMLMQPYLFPFILEYSLTAVAVYATMYQTLTLRIPQALYVSMQVIYL